MEQSPNIHNVQQMDNENHFCADCRSMNPLNVSINNGVFLCDNCAKAHKSLGVGISYVKSMKEEFDEYLLAYMIRGGNRRFDYLLTEYGIRKDADINYKYRTKAVENYRITVRQILIFLLVKI
jgi:ADP-ribosylation factor GTPase-activating protein 2/3